jgi:hypothetical protein
MRHLLPGIHPHVGKDAVAPFLQTQRLGHLCDGTPEARDGLGRRGGVEVGGADVLALGDDEDVGGCQRVDIVKGQRELVLMHALAGDFPAQDAGEDVGGVVGGQAGDAHAPRLRNPAPPRQEPSRNAARRPTGETPQKRHRPNNVRGE